MFEWILKILRPIRARWHGDIYDSFAAKMVEFCRANFYNQLALYNAGSRDIVLFTPWSSDKKTLPMQKTADGRLCYSSSGPLPVLPNRIFVSSIPKSGTHFIEVVLCNLGFIQPGVEAETHKLLDLRDVVPHDFSESHAIPVKVEMPYQLQVKFILPGQYFLGHVCADIMAASFQGSGQLFILLIRDLRHVFVSAVRHWYMQRSADKYDVNLRQPQELLAFFKDPSLVTPILDIIKSFIAVKDLPCFRVIRFEDWADKTNGNWAKVAETIAEVCACDYDAVLQAMEKAYGSADSWTYTGQHSTLERLWTPEVEEAFIELGGDVLNEQLGYSRHYAGVGKTDRREARRGCDMNTVKVEAESIHERQSSMENTSVEERIKLQDRYAREQTQLHPIELPLPPTGFFVKVKVDYPGMIIPNDEEYKYVELEKVILRDEAIIREYIEKIKALAFGELAFKIPHEKINERDPFWNNHMYECLDPHILYGLVAYLKPQKVIEIGSGFSTKFFRRAINDFGLTTELISIDPEPRTEIVSIPDRHIKEALQTAPLELFDTLQENDILFFDGSHITFNGTDTVHFFLNVLPRIKAGVYIHLHDIQLPWEYAAGYVAHYYSEQYMLAALLLNSSQYQVIMPTYWLSKTFEREIFGNEYAYDWRGVSFWIKKVSTIEEPYI